MISNLTAPACLPTDSVPSPRCRRVFGVLKWHTWCSDHTVLGSLHVWLTLKWANGICDESTTDLTQWSMFRNRRSCASGYKCLYQCSHYAFSKMHWALFCSKMNNVPFGSTPNPTNTLQPLGLIKKLSDFYIELGNGWWLLLMAHHW